MRTSILLFALLVSAPLSWAQFYGPTGQQRADKAQDQFDKTVPPPIHQQPSWISKNLEATRMNW
jgi:hypothetical protein